MGKNRKKIILDRKSWCFLQEAISPKKCAQEEKNSYQKILIYFHFPKETAGIIRKKREMQGKKSGFSTLDVFDY